MEEEMYFDDDEEQDSNQSITYEAHNNAISPWIETKEGVTALSNCDTKDVKSLYIFDIGYKLQKNNNYDIGGAHGDDCHLWFFFTTSTCIGCNYLMNIFVCSRQPSMFSLGISKSNNITNNSNGVLSLSSDLKWIKLNSTKPDTVHYIKTFQFSEKDKDFLQNNVLMIPLRIDFTSKSMLDNEVLVKLKCEHNFGEGLLKDQEFDFTLISSSGKEYKVHKIAIASHSPVIRDLIRPKELKKLVLDINDELMEMLLQYFYTGTIENILHKNFDTLIELLNKFQLHNLLLQVKHAIEMSIDPGNALSVALLAEKYNYDEIQETAFKYIQTHPEVLESDAFSEIDNAKLLKKLLKYIHVKGSSK